MIYRSSLARGAVLDLELRRVRGELVLTSLRAVSDAIEIRLFNPANGPVTGEVRIPSKAALAPTHCPPSGLSIWRACLLATHFPFRTPEP